MSDSTAVTSKPASPRIPKFWQGVVVLFAAVGVYSVFSSSGDGSTSAQEKTAVAPASAALPAVSAPAPSHNYAMREGGEYGYEAGISDEERSQGVAAKPLVMIRYLGERDGVLSVQVRDGNQKLTSSCEAPCEYVKSKWTVDDVVIKEETARNTSSSLIGAVMEDVMAGRLEPYKAPATKRAASIE